jgi:hypothetical protein
MEGQSKKVVESEAGEHKRDNGRSTPAYQSVSAIAIRKSGNSTPLNLCAANRSDVPRAMTTDAKARL